MTEAALLDARTGRLLRTTPIGPAGFEFSAPPSNAVAVNEQSGRAFVVNARDGAVYVLNTRTGQVRRRIPLGQAIQPIAMDPQVSRVFVGGPRCVGVLDAGSGRLVGRVALGADPTAIAVDERWGWVAVTSQGVRWDQSAGRLAATSLGQFTVVDARRLTARRIVPVGVAPGRW